MTLKVSDLERIAAGYISHTKYAIRHTSTGEVVRFDVRLVPLDAPYVKKFEWDAEIFERYTKILHAGYSFGAYDDGVLVGFIIGEPHAWNGSLWVWEFGVDEAYRKRGVGGRLMDSAAERARSAGLRRIVCEAQNTNVTAIAVYRRLGFEMEAVDISYYSNDDYPDGEMAIFMKRRL